MAFVRIVLLASGSGTLTQAVIDAFTGPGSADVEIVAIGSDSPTAGVLARAESADIPTFVVRPRDFSDRDAWNVR
ncbi:phosphoribosylglycinamide formyltransferase, partial [Burkholderia multivorans]